MVGARGGWAEADYISTPCAPIIAGKVTPVRTENPHLNVHIIPGVKQNDPPDVMRGEETQLAGLLRDTPDFSGTVCLPGTHSKWVEFTGGKIIGFSTFMTGELFALLSKQSLLRNILDPTGWNEPAFLQGISQSLQNPQMISSDLFGLRALSD